MDEREMDALLDVLEYDALANFEDEDPGVWTWDRPGQENVNMPLSFCKGMVQRWKVIHGPLV